MISMAIHGRDRRDDHAERGGHRERMARTPRKLAPLSPVLAVLLGACTGTISAPGVGQGGDSPGGGGSAGPTDPGIIDPGTPGSGAGSGTGAGGTGVPGGGAAGVGGPAACTPGSLPAGTRVVRLTHTQYDNSVRALTGLDVHPSTEFPVDQNQAGFDRGVDLMVGDALGKAYRTAAESIAAALVANAAAYQKVVGCDPATGDACAAAYVASFGQRVFRRPLGDAEKSSYLALFGKGSTLVDGTASAFQKGVQVTVEAFLQSPSFLYRPELSTAQTGGLVVLSGYELASRLSYFIQNAPPDDTLLAAAAAGVLTSADAVAAQARRLVATPAARDTVRDFHHQWLNLDVYANKLTKDPAYPTVTPALAPVLSAEAERFVDDVVFTQGKGFPSLMTAPFTYVNKTTAALYGVAGTFDDTLKRVDLDPTQRAGLLTQIGFLASNAYSNQSSPIHRGVFVVRRVLCGVIPDPPPNVPQLPPLGMAQTTRQAVDMHTAPTACAGCHHEIINPVGFGFENYDAVGKFRTTENGQAIDATGILADTAAGAAGTASFANAIQESALIAASPEAQACYAKTWLRYAFGRVESDGDKCAVGVLGQNLASDSYKVTDLLVDLTRTRAFMYRSPASN